MTHNESIVFDRLQNLLGGICYIYPQVHLNSIFYEKLKNGQSWRGARAHIEKKSVDYVVCDRATKKILFAIELDDKTHEYKPTAMNDDIKNKLFSDAGIPLKRIHFQDELNIEMFEDILGAMINLS